MTLAMSNQILICDTSAIIVLEKLGKLILLKELFDEVLITNEIKLEYGEYLPDWIKIEKPSDLLKSKILLLQLDPGEASAIWLALEKENPTLLIDERKGREIAS
jgi:predicted nucleic acid-binding protein